MRSRLLGGAVAAAAALSLPAIAHADTTTLELSGWIGDHDRIPTAELQKSGSLQAWHLIEPFPLMLGAGVQHWIISDTDAATTTLTMRAGWHAAGLAPAFRENHRSREYPGGPLQDHYGAVVDWGILGFAPYWALRYSNDVAEDNIDVTAAPLRDAWSFGAGIAFRMALIGRPWAFGGQAELFVAPVAALRTELELGVPRVRLVLAFDADGAIGNGVAAGLRIGHSF